MKDLINGQLIDIQSPVANLADRAFLYGDGIFETIICQDGRPLRWEDHCHRAYSGAAVLMLTGLPDPDTIYHAISSLLHQNDLAHGWAKVRWVIWRKPGGRYTPTDHRANWSLTTDAHHPKAISDITAGISRSAKVSLHAASRFKTTSALPYVLAGLEKAANGLEDMILLGEDGQVAEAIASNIFLYDGHQIRTPPLTSGCVEGVMRKHLIQLFVNKGFPLCTDSVSLHTLLRAQWIMLCNVSGYQCIRQIEGKRFEQIPNHIVSLL